MSRYRCPKLDRMSMINKHISTSRMCVKVRMIVNRKRPRPTRGVLASRGTRRNAYFDLSSGMIIPRATMIRAMTPTA